MPADLDWLIVGGGVHGAHIAARLLGEADVPSERLRIVDPEDQLLARWRACAETTGMNYLRSPSVHHIDLDPWSLERFAGKRKSRGPGLFASPYNRPALDLFNAHCDQVVETFGLADLHIQDRVAACAVGSEEVRVQLSSGQEIAARNLVLAVGVSDHPDWPEWAPRDHARVRHVFEPGFDGWPATRETVVVIGGGISAGLVALRLLDERHAVHLVSRHALRQHQFDSDPGWLGPKLMTGFRRERSFDRRRSLISTARNQGSVPRGVRRALTRAIDRGQLLWHQDEVDQLDAQADGVVLTLMDRSKLAADRVLLATGFASARPGGSMIDTLIDSASLPCASCGYPIVDAALRWHPRVFVTGPLAELELGPTSRNIAGARQAGARVVEAARAS
ncbi:MAG: FAD/NAD(P)-binding protein [Acidobacteriota bacterium]